MILALKTNEGGKMVRKDVASGMCILPLVAMLYTAHDLHVHPELFPPDPTVSITVEQRATAAPDVFRPYHTPTGWAVLSLDTKAQPRARDD